MPLLDRLRCPKCGFETEATSGTIPYTLKNGREVPLVHPGEMATLREATGLDWREAEEAGLLRSKTYCICLACAARFHLDIDRNPKRCVECNAEDVRSFRGAIQADCPACRAARLQLVAFGVS